MPRVDFVITNNRHHVEMVRPVVERLVDDSRFRCRVVSLCELRGMGSPRDAFRLDGLQFNQVIPGKLRRSPSLGRQPREGIPGPLRRLVRSVTWRGLIYRRMRVLWSPAPDLVVLPNDAAFPYDRLARQLRGSGIPFLLMQEGIRFPFPALPPEEDYGQGGATALAVWGRASAEYFRSLGLPAERVYVTGSPRHDDITPSKWRVRARQIRVRLGLGEDTLLLITNPIDDQGFCTSQEKYDLVRRFVVEIQPLFQNPSFHLAIKIHARESAAAYRALVASLVTRPRIAILEDASLYALFPASRAAVVMASTAGLEALLFDLPLAVLEIAPSGFPYDYVESGAAQGLTWAHAMAPQVELLMTDSAQGRTARRTYVREQLAYRGTAALRVERLIRRLVETSS